MTKRDIEIQIATLKSVQRTIDRILKIRNDYSLTDLYNGLEDEITTLEKQKEKAA